MTREPLPGWKPRGFDQGLFIDVGEGQIVVDNDGEWSIDLEVVGSTGRSFVPAQLAAEDAARAAVVEMATALGMVVVTPEDAERLAAYDRELSAVMPRDFKDWWENSRAEWPLVARMVIENYRLTEGGWPDAQEGGAP